MRPVVRTLRLLLGTLLLSTPARGQGAPAGSHPAPPPPGSELTVSILTMGTGAEVWERFGHNAIWVEDRLHGTSLAYNYGMFSFRQENFLLRFVQGRMLYWAAGLDAGADVERYRQAGRSVWSQELNLTPAERVALRDFLVWNAKDENKYYRYDYYRDNCSTRVRDAIDRILGGALRAQTESLPAGSTYRFHTQRLTTNDKLLYTGLLLIVGRGGDHPLSAWDEMFLPLKLRDHLRRVTVADSSGRQVPLVKAERTLYESDLYPTPAAPPDWLPWYLAIGLLLGSLLAGTAWRGGGAGLRVFVWLGGFWLLLTGVAGLIMAGMWAFTDHVIASGNENVLQLSLVALPLLWYIPRLRRSGPDAPSPARALGLLLAGLSLAGLLLSLIPRWGQANGEVLALTVPANLGLVLGVWRVTAARKSLPPETA